MLYTSNIIAHNHHTHNGFNVFLHLYIYNAYRSHFNSEAELNEYVTRLPGVPFSVPNRCLSGEESRSIEEEAQKTVNRVVEEFRRFKGT